MNAKIIPFPMHRVRRDPVAQMMQFYRDAFIANLNLLRAMYGLPPLEGDR